MELILLVTATLFVTVDAAADTRSGDDSLLPVKPEKCYGTDEIMDAHCCVFAPFFVREIARECGGIFEFRSVEKSSNVTLFRRRFVDDCSYWECILQKYDLLSEKKTLKEIEFNLHLDKWVTLNPEFEKPMAAAKSYCSKGFRFFMPLEACEFYNYQHCLRQNIIMSCPVMINSHVCEQQKEFYDQCREYFL